MTKRKKNNRFKKTHKKKKQYGGQDTSKSLTNMKNITRPPVNSKSQTTEFYDSSKIRFLPIDALKSPLIDVPVKETKYYLDDSIRTIPPLDLPRLPSKPVELPEALKRFKDVLPEELKPEKINKVIEGKPHIEDSLNAKKIALVINTSQGKQSIKDSFSLRRAALTSGTPYYTTIAGANAITEAIKSLKNYKFEVLALQDIN